MELDCVILIVFFTDTATTEIYTYGHTLSLHDALPILARLRKRAKGAKPLCPVSENDRLRTSSISAQGLQWLTTNNLPNDWSRNASATALWRAYRSEEHTSELQSLMRISYAVFCLKKKNKQTKQTTHTVTNIDEK